MRVYEKKARAARGTERARDKVDTDIISPQDIVCDGCTGKEWHNMLYRHEVHALAAAGVSKSGILVYAALTHWEKTPGKVYCVPAPKLAADTGFSLNIVYKAIEELQRKHIIKCVRKGTQGRKGEPGRSASYVSLINLPESVITESFAVGGESSNESLAIGGERLSENSPWCEESLAIGGEPTPESLADVGELKEHIKKDVAAPLRVAAKPTNPNPSMSLEEKRERLGIPSTRKRRAGGAPC